MARKHDRKTLVRKAEGKEPPKRAIYLSDTYRSIRVPASIHRQVLRLHQGDVTRNPKARRFVHSVYEIELPEGTIHVTLDTDTLHAATYVGLPGDFSFPKRK